MSILNLFSNIFTELKVFFSTLPLFKLLQLPFYPQDPDAERKFVSKHKLSESEFSKWIDSACGMFCLKMILKKKLNKEFSVIDLVDDSMKFGTYKILEDGKLSAMVYEPFAKFIKNKFGLGSKVCRFLSMRRIKYELSKDNFVIASVHWDIKDQLRNPPFKGGHLVVITGYSEKERCFFINNPTGIKNISQVNYKITYNNFKKFFARRGIIVQ